MFRRDLTRCELTTASVRQTEHVAGGTSRKEKRVFGTMSQHLRELARWLAEANVTAGEVEFPDQGAAVEHQHPLLA